MEAEPMYSLYCPACKHVTEQPFVRIGAIVHCGSCGQVYRVGREHLSHQASPRLELASGETDPLLPNGKPARLEATQHSSGLTGLSGLMEQERRQAKRATKPNPKVQPLPEASSGSGSGLPSVKPAPVEPTTAGRPRAGRDSSSARRRRPHGHRKQAYRQTQRLLVILAIALTGAVIALAALLYYARGPIQVGSPGPGAQPALTAEAAFAAPPPGSSHSL
jgi:hypothetical protein